MLTIYLGKIQAHFFPFSIHLINQEMIFHQSDGQSTQSLLNKYILANKIKSKIFIYLDTRKPITVDSVQKICQRIAQRLKINISISPHKWRYTFATSFVDNNGNMEVLRMLLGHTTALL